MSLGWFACVAAPQIVDRAGVGGARADPGGRRAYTAGAVVYALQRPDPRPAVFGYHEVFHVLVVAAAVMHFVAVAAFALPAAASVTRRSLTRAWTVAVRAFRILIPRVDQGSGK